MTWFLQRLERETEDVTPQPVPVPTRGAQFGAAFSEAGITENARFYRQRKAAAQISAMVDQLGGLDAIAPADDDDRASLGQRGGAASALAGANWRDQWSALPADRKVDYLTRRASLALQRDPARYGSIAVSPEQFQEQLVREMQAELEEAQEVLGAGDNPIVQFLGSLASYGTDEISIPLLAAGGLTVPVRQTARFVAQEALIGAGAELAALPRAQRQAALLELQDPNAWERIGTGALFGGVFGGALSGGARGIEYLRLRNRSEAQARSPDMDGPEHQLRVDQEEARLRSGDDAPVTRTEGEQSADAAGPLSDDAIISRIIGVESGGNPTAQNPNSSARGLGQFIESTWLRMINDHRPDLAAGRSRAQILALRDDADLNADMTRRYMQENRAHLQAAGVPTDPGALYLAHFMGRGGAVQALRAADDTPITSLMSAAAIRANAPIRHNGKQFADFTAADLRSWASAKMGRPASGRATAAASAESGINLGTSRPMTRYDEVTTPAGTRVPVQYDVVDLDSLVPARAEFQPRDRTRGASDEQVAEIAARLDALRLMPGPEADRGAPIIGPDMMVESGNGRVMALRRAADQHPDRYAAYVDAIRQQGFDVPEGMTRPALVASEQAGRDADFLGGNVFDAYQPGQPVAAQGEFLRRLLARMPQSERAAMYDATGRLNADGLRRIRQALFARAYGAPDLLRMLAESPDPRMRAMLDMLDDLAPDWAAFRASVDAGFIRPEFDVTDAMIDIVRTIARARSEGRDGQSVIAAIRDKLAQTDMFAARDDALAEALLTTFYKGNLARRPADAGDILRRYISEAQTVGRADADDLFGAVAPAEVLRQSIRNHEARADYTQAPARAGDSSVPDTRDMTPAPMLDGAESPVLIRAAEATEADIRAAVAPEPAARPSSLTSAQRSEIAARAQQSRIRRLDGNSGAEGPLFDTQGDLLAAPQRAPEAPPRDRAATPARQDDMAATAAPADEFAALRDLTLRLDENGPEIRVSDILDDLDANAEFADVVRLCNPRRA